MPRLFNCGKNVDLHCQKTGDGSSTHDVCADCAQGFSEHFPTLEPALEPGNGDPQGDAGWQLGADHPPYSDCDYSCELCHVKLTDDDN